MQYELNVIGFSLFKNACCGQGNEQNVPGRKSHSSTLELLVRCLRKMANPPIPHGVLMSLRDAVEEQRLSLGTFLLERSFQLCYLNLL